MKIALDEHLNELLFRENIWARDMIKIVFRNGMKTLQWRNAEQGLTAAWAMLGFSGSLMYHWLKQRFTTIFFSDINIKVHLIALL